MAKAATVTKNRRRADTADQHAGHDAHLEGVHDEYPKNWAPPAHLDAPKPRPGMAQRWVRESIRGEADPQNFANQLRQGWRPRSFTTVPVGERKRYPSVKLAEHGEVMKSGDLILCEIPQKLAQQMGAFYAAKRKGQITSLVAGHVREINAENDPDRGFGEIEVKHKSSVTRRPIVAADIDEE